MQYISVIFLYFYIRLRIYVLVFIKFLTWAIKVFSMWSTFSENKYLLHQNLNMELATRHFSRLDNSEHCLYVCWHEFESRCRQNDICGGRNLLGIFSFPNFILRILFISDPNFPFMSLGFSFILAFHLNVIRCQKNGCSYETTRYTNYRERKIRRNMLTPNPIQTQVRCCQIWGRRRKREENHVSGP